MFVKNKLIAASGLILVVVEILDNGQAAWCEDNDGQEFEIEIGQVDSFSC